MICAHKMNNNNIISDMNPIFLQIYIQHIFIAILCDFYNSNIPVSTIPIRIVSLTITFPFPGLPSIIKNTKISSKLVVHNIQDAHT